MAEDFDKEAHALRIVDILQGRLDDEAFAEVCEAFSAAIDQAAEYHGENTFRCPTCGSRWAIGLEAEEDEDG